MANLLLELPNKFYTNLFYLNEYSVLYNLHFHFLIESKFVDFQFAYFVSRVNVYNYKFDFNKCLIIYI